MERLSPKPVGLSRNQLYLARDRPPRSVAARGHSRSNADHLQILSQDHGAAQARSIVSRPEGLKFLAKLLTAAAVKGRKPIVTPAKGDIRLFAKDARVHAETMRYEPQPNKNVLGYWTKASDWADWTFDVPSAGTYEIEIQQGCGHGSGGAEVAVEVGGETFTFTVQDTGNFQQMIQRTIGQVQLSAGEQTLAIKPQSKPGVAVMDLRRVVLRPVQ